MSPPTPVRWPVSARPGGEEVQELRGFLAGAEVQFDEHVAPVVLWAVHAVPQHAIVAAQAREPVERLLPVAADVTNYATGGAVIIHYPVQDGTG